MTNQSAPSTPLPTPGQTIGPFFGYALPFEAGTRLVSPGHPGAITLHGTVRDGEGVPVPDALLEVWQSDERGQVLEAARLGDAGDGAAFTGWGRVETDLEGHYAFTTVRPGATGGRTPFIALAVFARGLTHRLLTRIYFPGAEDDLLAGLAPDRRATLVAVEDEVGYRFDVRLQGDGETVFLAHPGA